MAINSKLSTLMGENRYKIGDVHYKTGLSRTTISNLYHDRITEINFQFSKKVIDLKHGKTIQDSGVF